MTTTTPKELLGTTAPAGPPTTAAPRRGAGHGRRNRIVWSAAGAAAAVAIAAVTFTVTTTAPQERVQVQQATSTGQDVDAEEFLNRLANQGYIPSQAVDQQRLQLERAVSGGQVPAAALQSSSTVAPLYSPTDTKLIESVRRGHVPADVLDSRTLLLKRLANDGKIPRAATR